MEKRIKIALDFLKDGKPFTIEKLRLSLRSSNSLTVTGWSHYLNFSSLTKVNSISELIEIKNHFSDMVATSEDFRKFVENKSIEFLLCYDDGGKATIDICSEIDGYVRWHINI